jgi:hypothetical protein
MRDLLRRRQTLGHNNLWHLSRSRTFVICHSPSARGEESRLFKVFQGLLDYPVKPYNDRIEIIDKYCLIK